MSTFSVIDFLLAGFTDNSGNPLASGKVYAYSAGTTTPKDTYTDSGGTIPETNPIILDSNGRKQVYADGSYKLVVKTSADATLYTFDNLFFGTTLDFGAREATDLGDATARTSAITMGQVQDGKPWFISTVGGSANAITLTPSPAITAYAAGQRIGFIALSSCTGAVTIATSGLTAKSLNKGDGTQPTTEGDITEGYYYEAVYNGTAYVLVSPLGPVVIDREGTQVSKASTTAEETLYSETIKGDTLENYRGLRITAFGDIKNTTAGAVTLTFKIKLGSTTITTLGSINISATTVDRGLVIIQAWIFAADSESAQRGYATALITNSINGSNIAGSASSATGHVNLVGGNVSVAEAAGGDLTLSITGQLGTSGANIEMRMHNVVVEQL